MNRWIRRTVSSLSMASALALPLGIAFAQQSSAVASEQGDGHHKRERRHNLLREAQQLDSLTPDQRTAIEQISRENEAAAVPVRQANAKVLLQLAQQVEQAAIDPQALAPSLGAEESAAVALDAADRDAMTRLHSLLTPAQRTQLVDRVLADGDKPREAAEGHDRKGRDHREWEEKLGLTPDQKAKIAANLRGALHANKSAGQGELRARAIESFRGDSFDASAFRHLERRGEREETFANAILPVLTPAQRAAFAVRLRAHAARESS